MPTHDIERSRKCHPCPQPSSAVPAPPYVRKVLAVADLKRVAWQIDPIIPFQGNDAFTALSPLRRIPVYVDDTVTLCDSTAICEYLDETNPGREAERSGDESDSGHLRLRERPIPLLPATPAARARARWIEEFADTRMGDVFIWRIFNHAIIRPGIWKIPRDDAAIAAALQNDLPPIMDYLESIAPTEAFCTGPLAIADIAVAVHFANLRWSNTNADLTPWPKTTAWIARTEATPELARITNFGTRFITTRYPDRPALLAELNITQSPTTYAGETFRRGPMSV